MTDQRPIREIKLGNVWATIWQHEQEDGRIMHTVRFSRLFKGGGVWHDSASFGRMELFLLARVALMALGWVSAQPIEAAPQTADE